MVSTLDPVAALAEVYAAGLDGERWRDALTAITGVTGASGSQLLLADDSHRRSLFSVGIDPAENSRYNEHYSRLDPIPAKLAALGPGDILSCREAVTEGARRTTFFREWADPNEISDAVFLKLSSDGGPLWALALGHPYRSEPFLSQSLRKFLDTLAPHLVNALLIGRRLETIANEARASRSSFDALGCGWILVSDTCRLLSANDSALAMLRAQDGLMLRQGAVTMADAEADASFRRGIRAAAGRSGKATEFGLPIAVPRPSGAAPYQVRMMPNQATDACLGETRGKATIVVTDPARDEADLVRALRAAYGLTGAEAQLAIKVRLGRGLRQVAMERQVSISTARVHLQHIFEKTSTHRQSELIVLMERLRGRPRA